MSISFAALNGAEGIGRYISGPTQRAREDYQFRVFNALGELYIKQDRIKDAADTYALFVRRQPLHVQAPLLQARVVEIYEKSGFDTLALQAKKDHVERYGVDSEFRRANPSGWQRAQPLVKTHLVELARHHHALSQKTHQPADVQEAVRWYRTLLASFPADTDTAGNRFLLGELLYEDKRWAEAITEYETVAYKHASDAKAPDAGYTALLGLGTAALGRATWLEARLVVTVAVLAASFASTIIGMAVESLIAHSTPDEQKGRAAGWFQAGNLGGGGLGFGAGAGSATGARGVTTRVLRGGVRNAGASPGLSDIDACCRTSRCATTTAAVSPASGRSPGGPTVVIAACTPGRRTTAAPWPARAPPPRRPNGRQTSRQNPAPRYR